MLQGMGFFTRLFTRSTDSDTASDAIKPLIPSRTPNYDPLTLSTVFRGVQVLQTAIASLPIHEYKNDVKLDNVSTLIAQPDKARTRRDFISDIVASLVLDGNAFIRLVRFNGEVVNCEVLPPSLVTVENLSKDIAVPTLTYHYIGKTYGADDIAHLKFLNMPGQLRGLGPISAARAEIVSAQQARDYKAKFYNDSSNIKGYLKTEQTVPPEALRKLKDDWNKQGESSTVRAISAGLTYIPLDLKPADLQFLETQKFDTTQIARLLGIPASIMLAAVDGSNLTYSNIEQSWIEFADYTLSAYTGEIEELFNRLLPRGRTARFDWDSSRRADMSERLNAYKTAIDAGIYTVNEVRAKEGLQPLEGTSHE